MRYISFAIVALIVGTSAPGIGAAQPTQQVQQLFAQLQNPATSSQASAHLKTLAENNMDARQYLATNLPALLANASQDPVAWQNSIHLAGDLKIAEAVPILVQLLDHTHSGGPMTIAETMRLDDDPVGKSLAAIGEPAIAAVRNVLENDSNNQTIRMRVALILSNMNSKDADQVLALDLQTERDPRIKGLIQSQLREHAKTAAR